jgi:hypothetical protein
MAARHVAGGHHAVAAMQGGRPSVPAIVSAPPIAAIVPTFS